MKKRILFVSLKLEDNWIIKLKSIIDRDLIFEVTAMCKLWDYLQSGTYDVIIITEMSIINDYSIIRKINRYMPGSRIIIVTDAQDWKRARQAFQNGAADYIDISNDNIELFASIEEA